MSFTVTEWIQLASTGAIMPVLVFMLYKDMKKAEEKRSTESLKREEEARNRENSLLDHIKKSDETQAAIMKSIEQISASQQSMQNNMSLMQRDIEDLKKREC